MIGFGTYRDALARFVEALRRADVEALREIAARGRELEGGPRGRAEATSVPSSTRWTMTGCAPRPPPPSGSTSPGGSSTRICPICCPRSRRR